METRRPRLWEVDQGVDRRAVDVDLEVQVRPGRVAGAAFVADDLAFYHLGAVRLGVVGEVAVQGGEPIGVHDDDVVAVATEVGRGPRARHGEVVDEPTIGGPHGSAPVGGDVDPRVEVPVGAARLV